MNLHDDARCEFMQMKQFGACLCFSVFPRRPVMSNITVDPAGVAHDKDNTGFIEHKWKATHIPLHTNTFSVCWNFSLLVLLVRWIHGSGWNSISLVLQTKLWMDSTPDTYAKKWIMDLAVLSWDSFWPKWNRILVSLISNQDGCRLKSVTATYFRSVVKPSLK